MEFLTAESLSELATKVTEALTEGKLLHGDWKILTVGGYAQAVCPADWRAMPPPPGADSPILQPQPGRILG